MPLFNKMVKSRIEGLLEKLNNSCVYNDREFLECLIDLDERLKKLEPKGCAKCGTAKSEKTGKCLCEMNL